MLKSKTHSAASYSRFVADSAGIFCRFTMECLVDRTQLIPCKRKKQWLQPVGSCTRVARARRVHHAHVDYLAGGACIGSGACVSDFKSSVCTECAGSPPALRSSLMPLLSLKHLERHFCLRGKQTSIFRTTLPGKLRGPGYTKSESKLHAGATNFMIKGVGAQIVTRVQHGSLEGVIFCRMFEISFRVVLSSLCA